jgi:hypothetical protein
MIRKSLLILTAALGLLTSAQAGGYTHYYRSPQGFDMWMDDWGNIKEICPNGAIGYGHVDLASGQWRMRLTTGLIEWGNIYTGAYGNNWRPRK